MVFGPVVADACLPACATHCPFSFVILKNYYYYFLLWFFVVNIDCTLWFALRALCVLTLYMRRRDVVARLGYIVRFCVTFYLTENISLFGHHHFTIRLVMSGDL